MKVFSGMIGTGLVLEEWTRGNVACGKPSFVNTWRVWNGIILIHAKTTASVCCPSIAVLVAVCGSMVYRGVSMPLRRSNGLR